MATTKTHHQDTSEDSSPSKTAVYRDSAVSLLLSVSCALLSALAAQFMRLSSQAGVPGLQLIFLMKLAQLIFYLVVLPIYRPKLTTEDTPQAMVLFLSAVTDNLGTIFAFLSFVFVVPGIAFGVIQGSIPFSTACVAFIFLKERVGVLDSCGILCCAAGVILVAFGMSMDDESSSRGLTISLLLPISAAFTKGPNNVIMRFLIGVRGVSVLTVMFYAQLLGTVVLLALTYAFETPRWTMSGRTVGYVIGLCLCDTFASLSVKLILKVEKAGVVATLLTLVIPFTILLDYPFQSHFPDAMELGGITLVVLGTAVVGGHAWWVNRQEMRQKILLEKMNFSK
ncbi:SLC35G2 [Branchiostoma lanceolatum]|uniref:SLC35G2 protein n=1 Tax=Branchiostoma lanceolatum TaxID=7740 RepID=A0A8J9ZK12_BRALA|nr:SLC35G2 [Branchiostoma lanceolatum]